MKRFPRGCDELAALEARVNVAVKVFHAEAAAAVPDDLSGLLRSIPGVGSLTMATLVSEIGDVGRFRSADALVAYAGLDPKVSQSGVSLNRNSRLTKRGSPYLRRALFLAAGVARRFDPELRAIYERKRAAGKRHAGATIAVAQRLANRIYAVWMRGSAYERRTVAGIENTPAIKRA